MSRRSKEEERSGIELTNIDGIKLKCIKYNNAHNITVEAQILINDKIHKVIFENKIWDNFYNLNKNGFSTMQVKRVTVDSVDYKFCSKCKKWQRNDEFGFRAGRANKRSECKKCIEEYMKNKNTDWKYDEDNESEFNEEFKGVWIYLASCYKKGKKFIKARCIKCNHINDKDIHNYKQGTSCSNCSDGISIPNKILREISRQFNLDWTFEDEEGKKYRRDARDKNCKLNPEMDGNYGNHTEEYHTERDRYFLLRGEYTLRIDLTDNKEYRRNLLEYIQKQILKSNLPQVLYYAYGIDFNNFDWNEAWINCQKSLCIESWKWWSKGLGTDYISKELKVDRNTITEWLKRGKESRVINYNVKESIRRKGQLYKVIDQYENEMYLYGNKIWNENRCRGFLDIPNKTFKKYIEEYGIIDIDKIEAGKSTNTLRKKLAPFNGTRFIKIERYSKKQLKNTNQQIEKSNLPLLLDYVHVIDLDLNEVWTYCQNSLCIETWKLWSKGLGVDYIVKALKASRATKALKISRTTIQRWLNIGQKNKLINNYNLKESIRRKGKLYKVIDQYENEMYLYGNKIWNANGYNGFLDISFGMFKKHIEPCGIIDINKEEVSYTSILRKKLAPFNGIQFIKIDY